MPHGISCIVFIPPNAFPIRHERSQGVPSAVPAMIDNTFEKARVKIDGLKQG
jgi:hypothetical protein